MVYRAGGLGANLPKITRKESRKRSSCFFTTTLRCQRRRKFYLGHHKVWDCLVAVFVDRQGLVPAEIVSDARIAQDLGVD